MPKNYELKDIPSIPPLDLLRATQSNPTLLINDEKKDLFYLLSNLR